MDWLGPIVEIIKCLWDPFSRQIAYIKNLDDNLDTLKRETEELKCMRDGIRTEVKHAEECGKIPAPLSQNWLKDADGWIDQVNSIRSKPEGGGRGFYFTDLNARRKLGKKVVSLSDEVQRHKRKGEDLEEGKAAKRARRSLMPDKRDVPRELEEQSSSKEAVEKILQWLKEEDVGVICVWGMAGAGKTTIVKQVSNRIQGTNDFQQVIWVTVSKHCDLEAIQKRIANKLELKFEANEGMEDRQDRLRCTLNNVRYVLILDDVGQKLSLEQVGIPQPNRENRCKIVITSCRSEVSNEMEADRTIKIEPVIPRYS